MICDLNAPDQEFFVLQVLPHQFHHLLWIWQRPTCQLSYCYPQDNTAVLIFGLCIRSIDCAAVLTLWLCTGHWALAQIVISSTIAYCHHQYDHFHPHDRTFQPCVDEIIINVRHGRSSIANPTLKWMDGWIRTMVHSLSRDRLNHAQCMNFF